MDGALLPLNEITLVEDGGRHEIRIVLGGKALVRKDRSATADLLETS